MKNLRKIATSGEVVQEAFTTVYYATESRKVFVKPLEVTKDPTITRFYDGDNLVIEYDYIGTLPYTDTSTYFNRIVLGTHITDIDEQALVRANTVTIPTSVTRIGFGNYVQTVYYQGTKEQWKSIDGYKNVGSAEVYCTDGVFGSEPSEPSEPSFPLHEETKLFNGETLVKSALVTGQLTKSSMGYQQWNSIPNYTVCEVGTKVTSLQSGVYSCGNSLEFTDALFARQSNITKVYIPTSVTYIDARCFYGCSSLREIYYNGTKSQWGSISLGSNWCEGLPDGFKVICTDGNISYANSGCNSGSYDYGCYGCGCQ